MSLGADPVEELIAVGIAADLARDALRRLGVIARTESFPAGVYLLREGQRSTDLGVVLEGRIALRMHVPGRPDATIMTLDRGDVFGWSAALAEPSTSSVVTLGPTRVVLLDQDGLLELLATDSDVAAILYRRLLRTVARRLVATRLQLLDLYRAAEGNP